MTLQLSTFTSLGDPPPLVYALVAPSTGSAVDMARARRHLRLDESDTDAVETDLIADAVAAAAGHLDGRTGILNRALLTQTWQVTGWRPGRCPRGLGLGFVLDLAPIQAVTTVEVLDGGAYTALPAATWRMVRLPGERVAVLPAPDTAWPSVDLDPEAWRITFRAGYGDTADALPAPIRSALLLMVSDLFDNRDGKIQANLVDNPTVDRLLAPFQRIEV